MSKGTKYEPLKQTTKPYKNPEASANLLSRLTYWWMNEIFKTGSERPLENHDLFPLLNEDKTEKLTEKLQKEFNAVKVDLPENKHLHLLKALLNMFPGYFYLFTICAGLTGALCNVLQPVFLSLLLSQLLQTSSINYKSCYMYAGGICVSSLIRCIVLQQFAERNLVTAMRWRAATIGVIFKKVSTVLYVHMVVFTTSEVPYKLWK